MVKTKILEKGFTLPEGFCVGFSNRVVNPAPGVSMAGYGVVNARERLTTGVRDDLKICCTAYSDGEEMFLAFTFDSCHIVDSVARPMYALLEENIGIPEENVFFHAVHTHAAPTMYSSHESFPGVANYLKTVFHPNLILVAEEAIRDLAPAKIYGGRGKTEGLSYVRRYLLNDGTYKTNPRGDDVPVSHETPHDETMQVVRYVREGKKDVVMVNWQCHPTSAGGSKETLVSADWVGVLRDKIEAELGVHCIYHNGASGNIVASGQLPGENVFKKDRFREHGELIANVALSILEGGMEPLSSGKVKIQKKILTIDRKDETRPAAKVPITAATIGDVAFATVPYEMFSQNGSFVKENSPFKMTFMVQVTNDDYNYVAAEDIYDHGSYEVRICPFKKGAAEEIAGELVEMLKKI
jgi:hypothetical protein